MRVIRVPMIVDTPAAEYSLRVELPSHARVAAIGLIVDSQAALLDHEVLGMQHGGRRAVTTDKLSASTVGPHLGAFACALPAENYNTGQVAAPRFLPWSGRYNDPADWQRLVRNLAEGGRLNNRERARLRLAQQVPCERFTLWPITNQVEFRVDLKRIHGSTSIARAELVCIDFSDGDEDALEVLCGQADLTDYPHWLTQGVSMAAAANSEVERQLRWQDSNIPPHALRLHHLFAAAYSDTSGTRAYDPTYLAATRLLLRGDAGGRLWPSYADVRSPLTSQSVQLIQHVDCWRLVERVLHWNASLHTELEKDATDQVAELRLGYYGLLRPQDHSGSVADRW